MRIHMQLMNRNESAGSWARAVSRCELRGARIAARIAAWPLQLLLVVMMRFTLSPSITQGSHESGYSSL